MITLEEYAERILKPAIQKLEEEKEMTAKEIVAECEAKLAFSRRVLHDARNSLMNDD